MTVAARTAGDALGPTDVPASTVSPDLSVREVRARPFYISTMFCGFLQAVRLGYLLLNTKQEL